VAITKYTGRNVVLANVSSQNNGKAATLRVVDRKTTIVLAHGIDGGNEYAIALERAGPVADLAARLIAQCPKSSLPRLLAAIGELIAREG
jgi:hypothetical protein